MNPKNPTVALHVTAKELAVIERALGWPAQIGALRDKLNAAGKDMKIANRDKNRLNKQTRLARKNNLLRGELCPSNTSLSE